jgi:hypothetical protein
MNSPAGAAATAPARPDSVRPRTVRKGEPMPPQPPRTIFPTSPRP